MFRLQPRRVNVQGALSRPFLKGLGGPERGAVVEEPGLLGLSGFQSIDSIALSHTGAVSLIWSLYCVLQAFGSQVSFRALELLACEP
jgi:hypothetical protein